MPLTTSHDAQIGLLRILCQGEVTMEERTACVRDILENPAYPKGTSTLINVNGATSTLADGDFVPVANLIRLLRSRFHGRVGILNTRSGHVTASQLVAFTADQSQEAVRVFYSEKEAVAWLKNHG